MDLGLQGTTAIVGGGSSGIGLATAELLRDEGANVVIFARRPGPLQEVADRIGAVAVPGDQRSADDMKNVAEATVERFGGIDIVVNSGAVVPPTEVLDVNDENLTDALDAFLFSAIRLTNHALPYLLKSGRGRVINIAARAVREPNQHHATSGITRLGLVGWAKMLSNEIADKNVTVNTLAIGWIDTSANKLDKDVIAKLPPVPVGRPGNEQEVAAFIAFLASTHSSYMTGATLPVDGGLTRFTL